MTTTPPSKPAKTPRRKTEKKAQVDHAGAAGVPELQAFAGLYTATLRHYPPAEREVLAARAEQLAKAVYQALTKG